MLEIIIHWITEHGYGVIFTLFALGILGIPLPNDWLLAYLGYLIFKGKLLPAPTVAAASIGSICGMTLNYVLGRTFGLYLVKKFGTIVHLTPEKITRLHNWFEHSGKWGLLVGYFLPGVRHLTAFAAGTSKMIFAEFALFAYIGGFFWSVAFISLGYFLEERWSRATEKIHHVLEIGSLAVLIALTVYLLVQMRKKKQGSS